MPFDTTHALRSATQSVAQSPLASLLRNPLAVAVVLGVLALVVLLSVFPAVSVNASLVRTGLYLWLINSAILLMHYSLLRASVATPQSSYVFDALGQRYRARPERVGGADEFPGAPDARLPCTASCPAGGAQAAPARRAEADFEPAVSAARDVSAIRFPSAVTPLSLTG